MQVQKTRTPKLCPGTVILELKLPLQQWIEEWKGKPSRVFALSLIKDIDSSSNISRNSSFDHHKYYYILCIWLNVNSLYIIQNICRTRETKLPETTNPRKRRS